jgi:broad specificity phosphatase PhoE
MQLLLIRHGETEWNATLRYQGPDVPLNERGRLQARLLGERLRAQGVKALYASDLIRAWETAELVGEVLGLRPEPMPDLREIDVGQWEGLTPEELYRRFPEHMREYDRDPARTVRLGGESYAQLQERALRALHALEQRHAVAGDAVVAAVAHGGTIRALLCHVIGLDLAQFGRIWLDNGSISELRYRKGSWRLLGLNDRCHLADLGQFASGE